MKGVSDVKMDFAKGLFTLTVKEGTVITPSLVRKTVPTKFKIPSIAVSDMRGKLNKSKKGLQFKAAGQKADFKLTDTKKATAKIDSGQMVLVSGKLSEKKGKKKAHLVIDVSSAKVVKKKK